MSKHLTSDVNHTLSTYKKLPPIQSPTPGKGTSLIKPITVARSVNHSKSPSLQRDGAVIQGTRILSPKERNLESTIPVGSQISQKGGAVSPVDSKHVFKSTDLVGNRSGSEKKNVELIGYKTIDNEVKRTTPASAGWTPPGSELPPCKICDDKASGLHYGVYTCEACKAFFRRTLKRANVDFQCICTEEERQKGVDQPRKTTCPKCRYERCVKVGMSKDAIKIGRYTINRKRQNDREVSQLKEQGKIGSTGTSSENSPASGSSGSPYSSGQSVSSPEELSTNITSLSIEETKETLAAKRKRGNDYKGDGILFKSLTNSIVMSLLENQKTAGSPNVTVKTESNAEVSHLEELYRQPFQAPEGVTKQPEAPPGVKFTPTQDQFMMLQKGGNSNPFSVPPKGGNTQTPSISAQNVQGSFKIPQDGIAYQVSQTQGIGSVNQNALSTGRAANQNTAVGGSVTLQIVNQGGKLIAQKAIDNEVSSIEMLLQTPSELSPFAGGQSYIGSDLSLDAASENSPKSEPGIFGYDHDAVVPTMINDSLPSPLTEETGYDLDNINLPVEELPVNGILSTKTEELLNTLDSDFDLAVDMEDLPDGDEGYFDIDYQLEQFDIYQEPVISPGKGISMEEINTTIADLSSTAEALELGVKKMSCAEIRQRHAKYLEQYKLKTEVFGKMSISREEYITFYNQTGIDIDNRQDIVIEALKYFEESIAKLVKFAKAIPGFPDLDINDQVHLIKASRFSQDMLKTGDGGSCMKGDTEVATMPWNKDYHVEELSKVFPKDFMDWKWEYIKKVYNLDMTFDESAVCRAIIVTFPDQCSLKNRDAIVAIHNKLIACLCHLLAVRPIGRKPVSCTQVMEVLVELVNVGQRGNRMIKEVLEIWPVSNNHSLLKEVLS